MTLNELTMKAKWGPNIENLFRIHGSKHIKILISQNISSCLKNCDKVLKFVNFRNGGVASQRSILHVMWKLLTIPSLILVDDRSACLQMKRELSDYSRF